MLLDPWRASWASAIAVALSLFTAAAAKEHKELTHAGIPKPSYHYGAKIPVTCLNRSMYVLSPLIHFKRPPLPVQFRAYK